MNERLAAVTVAWICVCYAALVIDAERGHLFIHSFIYSFIHSLFDSDHMSNRPRCNPVCQWLNAHVIRIQTAFSSVTEVSFL